MTGKFDCKSKIWGASTVRLSPFHLNALRLKYALLDLKEVSGKALEVGCGAGGMAKAIKFYRPDLEVFGCDINKKAIGQANKSQEGVIFKVGDALSLPYKDKFFEAVLSFDFLEHLEDPKKAISEIYRVLKSDGLFHSFVPCDGSLFTLHGILNRLGWQAKRIYGGHIQEFSYGQIKELLIRGGFKILSWRYSGHFFNQLVDVVYFTLLKAGGRNVPYSVEGYLEVAGKRGFSKILGFAKNAISVISFLESTLFSFFPANGAHVGAVKT